jgi:peptidoglycan/xylan/chitin deacetylase (PgdA/CDA1 family)
MTTATRAARVLDATWLGALLRRLDLWDGVLTFAYHRIGDGTRALFDRGLWSASAEDFDAQMHVLASEADVISVHDLRRVKRLGRGRHVLVTFDDGYRDHYDTAFPILRRHGLGATFFLATSFLDRPRVAWWDEIGWMVHVTTARELRLPDWLPQALPIGGSDREAAVRLLVRASQAMSSDRRHRFLAALGDALRVGRCQAELACETWLTWDMAREMQRAGMSFGGHTASHPVLARESPARQRGEIAGCGDRLARELSIPLRYFSYPIGLRDAFDADTRACLRDAGVLVALSSYGGMSSFDDWDAYDVRRTTLAPGAGAQAVRATISHPGLFARW